jgi:hypothetical protein
MMRFWVIISLLSGLVLASEHQGRPLASGASNEAEPPIRAQRASKREIIIAMQPILSIGNVTKQPNRRGPAEPAISLSQTYYRDPYQ